MKYALALTVLAFVFESSIAEARLQVVQAQSATTMIPFIGTWKENPAKSNYGSSQPRSPGTVWRIEDRGEGMFVQTAIAEAPDGSKRSSTWTMKCDGKDYPASIFDMPGGHGFVSCTASDPSTFVFTVKYANHAVANLFIWAMSADGRAFTETIRGLNENGQPVRVLVAGGLVFEKQP